MQENKKIVIVDDEPDIILTVKAMLQTKGYEILSAGDGKAGLDLINQVKPDLIILDLMMPVMSGLEVCKILHNDPVLNSIPIIVMSAIGSKSGKSEEFWKLGLKSDDFISKPFDPLNLLGRVEYLIRRDNYVSEKNTNGGSQKEEINFAELPPKAIVKYFIESWNTKDFDAEYNCLTPEMTGNLTQKNYSRRRSQFYLDEKGENQKQILSKIISIEEDHDLAVVSCVREDTKNNFKHQLKQEYHLKKTSEGWKIYNVKAIK